MHKPELAEPLQGNVIIIRSLRLPGWLPCRRAKSTESELDSRVPTRQLGFRHAWPPKHVFLICDSETEVRVLLVCADKTQLGVQGMMIPSENVMISNDDNNNDQKWCVFDEVF